MKCVFYAVVLLWVWVADGSIQGERVYLSGRDAEDAVMWDFFCSAGRNSGKWTKIAVPSNWEQEGFGSYNYGHDDPAEKHAEVGTYRRDFFVPVEWKGRHVRLVFEGVMTQASVKLNGKLVGFDNYGGYTAFHHVLDKTNIKYGAKNKLEVTVKKKPDNESLDRAERKADYWVFGGIYRPVYLEVLPKEFVNRVAIDARADGRFKMDIFPQVQYPTKFWQKFMIYTDEVRAQIQTLDGVDVGEPMRAAIHGARGRISVETMVENPLCWSPEMPNRYQVKVTMLHEGRVLSERTETFGFRSVELRPGDGFYLNGIKQRIKGINRNMFDPDHGRVISEERAWADARAIKAMNVNLVRSHLPPTSAFMEACDTLGLMVITELCNWHDPAIDTPIARNIVYSLVTTYQNYPSVVMWANGNENGFNLEVDELYYLYDPQERPVLHPWAYYDGINTYHYPDYPALQEQLNKPVVYLPTEFLHGLYDGGHGAGLEDYWRLMSETPTCAGGVLWCWADAALVRTDQDGKLDTHGNKSADGIVGPRGEKEASYFTVRDIWSPVQIEMETFDASFDGRIPVANQYSELSLDRCQFEWKWLRYGRALEKEATVRVLADGKMVGPSVRAGEQGWLVVPYETYLQTSDALALTAFDAAGREVMHWVLDKENVFGLPERDEEPITVNQNDERIEVVVGDTQWLFSADSGQLLDGLRGGQSLGLTRGPFRQVGTLEHESLEFAVAWTVQLQQREDHLMIRSIGSDGSWFEWTINAMGDAHLRYSFVLQDEKVAYAAIGFDLAEELLEGKRWLGRGPHRLWGNRMKGPEFGVWENGYNDDVVGVDWGAPAFKGIFDGVDWMRLDVKSDLAILMDCEEPEAVGVLRPRNADESRNEKNHIGPVHAWWHYPAEGELFIFHKIPGVGTKFANAHELGPQGSPSALESPLTGSITFRLMAR